MNVRWWRMGVIYERGGNPWTHTFHVRAFTEEGARRLVGQRLVGIRHAFHACQPSDPLLRVANREEIVAEFGPYERSWDDETIQHLRELV